MDSAGIEAYYCLRGTRFNVQLGSTVIYNHRLSTNDNSQSLKWKPKTLAVIKDAKQNPTSDSQ